MLELVVIRGEQELVAVPLERERFRLGRATTNDLALPEPTVSRVQCELVSSPHGWRLIDRSGKGTRLDGALVPEAELKPGARIGCGSLAVLVRLRAEESPPGATLSGRGTDAQPGAQGEEGELVLVGELQGQPLRLELSGAGLSLGADPANDLCAPLPYVSAFHCRLARVGGAWHVQDLGSTNGTWVNGVRVGEARLDAGALLRLGELSLRAEPARPAAAPEDFLGLLSADPAMQPVFELVRRAAPTDETVLVTGESGSGKELVARAIHRLSRRAAGPLVPVNCSAITRELLESELFGHERGAFTGAQARRRGLFEEANGGTLFLDEIGELALDLQAKLLRVLENGEIRPVGSSAPRRVDTRVVAATHRSLLERVRAGAFREDLFFRVQVIEVAIPPLRARPADVPLLAAHFLAAATRHTRPRRLSPAALARLKGYRFPGNVRELKHTVTRAAILSPDDEIGPEHLTFLAPSLADRVAEGRTYSPARTWREIETEALRQALEAADGNQKEAARSLGIARSTLTQRMEKCGLRPGPRPPRDEQA
ncbi:MAG TPA: sigma 54-interacting transcriptional regulator [Myxococcota bacterium]|nr:sigma 54-interacting transcriptional regulator [Myxococcota bacterium]HRY92133.1 sigma 54-interacting transcriptional regulator [Myxococcota bacterium]HSA21726.1 sigma 54-interacting transcriptional regulator [Myxococcota bacterium]